MRSRRHRRSRLPVLIGFAALGLVAASIGSAGPAVAAPVPAAAPATTAGTPTALTEDQAVAQARRTGRPTPVDGSTTETRLVTANPDGSLTLTESLVPQRKLVAGHWKTLDATLHRNPDGTVSPALTTDSLTLGGAGTTLATMASGTRRITLTSPVTLPTPTLSGDTATYAAVLPGVDLQVRAGTQGELSETLIVRTPAAAANPALRSFSFGTATAGFTLTTGADGGLTGRDAAGHQVLSAPPAVMWDSGTTTHRTAPDLRTGRALDVTTGSPATSDARFPGSAARRAAVGVRVGGGHLTLTPDPLLLRNGKFPLYIDPSVTWTPASGSFNGWAVVSTIGTTTKYWKNSPSGADDAQAGLAPGLDDTRRTLLSFAIPSQIFGTTTAVQSAELDVFESWSYNCTAQKVDVYAPSKDLTSANADWNDWTSGWGSLVNEQNVAYGWSSSCPGHNIGFDVTTPLTSDAHGSNSSQTFLVKANNEGTESTWKRFEVTGANAPKLQIKYNRPPSVPTGLKTSPPTSCSATSPTTIGDAAVTLIAPVSDPEGNLLGVTYKMWKTVDTSQTAVFTTNPNTMTASSGTNAQAVVPQATLDAAAAGAATKFTWEVQVWDGGFTSNWSATCTFNFDPTRPGKPDVQPVDSSYTMGQQATFNVNPPTGPAPAGYIYQVNAGPPVSIGLGQQIKFTPNRFSNTLSVTAVSAGGNLGTDTAIVPFNAAPPAVPASDSDLTGDTAADLLIPGAGGQVAAAGLWQVAGRNDGTVNPVATDIGINGNGVSGAYSATDFTGSQPIIGHFTGAGLQDILVYEPPGAPSNPTGAEILNGNGDGSILQTQLSGTEHTVSGGSFTDGLDDPVQLVNVGNASQRGLAYPDLIGINGDDASGWNLEYYTSTNSTGGWDFPVVLGAPPGTGTSWKDWTITSAQTSAGTTLMLWDASTGALYAWTNLTYSNGTLTYDEFQVASNWNTLPASPLRLQAADIDGTGPVDVWTVDSTGKVTPNIVTLGTTPSIAAGTAQTLITSAHSWPLSDIGTANSGDPATAPADVAGTLTLTGGTGAQWNSGDLFSPDVLLNGTSTGNLATGTKAVSTDADFTVSAWVKITTAGGTVFSQNGTNTAGFKVWVDSSDTSWRFAMSTSDVASPTWDTVAAPANSARLAVWNQVTATYNHSTGTMNLYVNGLRVAYGTHTTKWSAGGAFEIGQVKTGASTYGGFLNGQVAQVNAWNQPADPSAPTSAASYYVPMTPFRIMDTRAASRIGPTTGPLASGQVVKTQMTGVDNIPAIGVTAVAVNVTVLPGTVGSYLALYPDLVQRPITSTVNYTAGVAISNLSVVPVGTNGYVDLYVNSSGTNVLMDVVGYYTSDVQATGITSYTPMNPIRMIDSRSGIGVPTGQVNTGSTSYVQMGGVNGMPAGGTTPGSLKAVVLNLIGNAATGSGYFAPYASGTSLPAPYSTTQFPVSSAAGSLVIAPVGTDGKVAIYTAASGGKTDMIGDVVGYFTLGTAGEKFYTVNATRLLDTRESPGTPVPANTVTKVSQGTLVQALQPTLLLNTVVVSPTSGGLLVAYPDGITRPGTTAINFSSGVTIANADFASTGGGKVDLYDQLSTGATTHLVVDCLGYFSAH